MKESIQKRSTVVTEGWRGVRMDLKLVPGAIGLELKQGLIIYLEFVLKEQHSLERKRRIEQDRNGNEIRNIICKYYIGFGSF